MGNSKRSLTTTSYAVLGLLCIRPWSAYDLAKQMQRSLRFVWPRATSGVYEEPKKLVAHGLASATRQPAGRRRTRSVYSVTPKGREAFRRWLAQPSAPPQFESEALVRVLFAEHGTKQDLLATIRALQEQMQGLGRQGAALIAEHVEGGPFPQRLHLIALATRLFAGYITQVQDWAAWAQAEVENWSDTRPLTEVAEAIERYREILGEELIEEARRVLEGEGPARAVGPSAAEVG